MADQRNLLGQVFSKFRIDAQLGEGGMGVVYRAQDLELDRPVALKFLVAQGTQIHSERARLIREAQAAARLNHPNICTVYEVSEAEGRFFIAMEYLDGKDVKSLLDHGALQWRQALSICIQVTRALAVAHAGGIVHKDVKSQNIFVTRQGLVKLLDFGIAHARLEPDATRTTVIAGSPYYMSPEQIETADCGASCDIWALGVVLYEMLTGILPFGRQGGSIFRSILLDDPEPVSQVTPGIPAAFDQVLGRALEKDVRLRYARVEEMAADLEQISGAGYLPLTQTITDAREAADKESDPFADPRSIAVLPLINISPDPENEYICDGLAEEIINGLTQMGDLRVVSRSSSFQCKGTTPNVRDVARKLRCSLLVHGSLRRSGDLLRLTVQLSEGKEGYQVWSQRFDAKIRDLFTLQDELTTAVLDKLREQLGMRLPVCEAKRQSANPEAYQIYLQARFAFHQETPTSLRHALSLFLESSKADPSYAPALIGVAESEMRLEWYGLEASAGSIARARVALQSALRLEPGSVPALYLLATIQAGYDWDWETAGKTFDRALTAGSGVVAAHFHYALDYLTPQGRLDEALRELQHAVALDPLSPIARTAVGGCCYRMRRWTDAAKSLRATVAAYPDFAHAHWALGRVLLEQSEFDDALRHFEQGSRIMGESPGALAELGYCYARMGRHEEASRMGQQLRQMHERAYVSPLHRALIYTGLGQQDEAIAQLQQAFDNRIRQLVWVNVDPRFDSLRSNPEFARLVARLGLAPNATHRKPEQPLGAL